MPSAEPTPALRSALFVAEGTEGRARGECSERGGGRLIAAEEGDLCQGQIELEGLEGIPEKDRRGRPLSQYERERLANMRENERRLVALQRTKTV